MKKDMTTNVEPMDRLKKDFERVFERRVEVGKTGHDGDILPREFAGKLLSQDFPEQADPSLAVGLK